MKFAVTIVCLVLGFSTGSVMIVGSLCSELRQTREAMDRLEKQVQRVGDQLEGWRSGP